MRGKSNKRTETSVNKDLHNLYSSCSNTRVVKSRKINRARHVARTGRVKVQNAVFVGKPEGKNYRVVQI